MPVHITQADITDRKTFRHNVFDWKVGQRGKRGCRPEQFCLKIGKQPIPRE